MLGSPIAHSKSPLLHRAAFAELGMESSEYDRFELRADELEGFLDSHPDHIGFSLTMPLKDRLVTLAVERGWNVDDTAALTAAGNTLVRRSGQVEVANTDVRGIVRAIAPRMEASPDANSGAGAGRATILGAGATAASALVACRDLGIAHVDFRVRNPDRARRVIDLAERIGLTASVADLTRIEPSAIVISTLPAEAAPTRSGTIPSPPVGSPSTSRTPPSRPSSPQLPHTDCTPSTARRCSSNRPSPNSRCSSTQPGPRTRRRRRTCRQQMI